MTTRPGPIQILGLIARTVLGGVMLVAGMSKLRDLTAATQSVLAYELFDYDVARLIATVLPVVEVAVGLLLLLGLLTRAGAVVVAALMVVFIAGIVSAWARGLSIDCGCFSSGGPVDPDETTYLIDILRDAGLLVLAAALALRPHTPWSLDHLLTKGR